MTNANKRRRKPGDATKAVAVIRASKDEQVLSPEAQRAAIETWAKREGVEVVAWHVEQGVKGATPLERRTGLLDAIGDLERYGAGRLVVVRRDRLARDVVVAGLIERLVERAGGRVCTTDGMGDAEGPEGVLLRGIADLFAVYERLVIASRTRAALQAKKSRGERTGMVPFGYAVADDGIKLVASPTEQQIIATVRRLRGKGLTLRAVVSECERRGIVSRSGKPLGLVQVDRLLRRAAA
jgi:DNA invertase Pin-like site-specific DNA recombinase